MEESEKINGKKKLPYIPANFVTILQLQERWKKEKEGKQKGKEEKEEPKQREEKNEAKVEEQVNDEVARRGSREIGRFCRLKNEKDGKQNGKEEKEKGEPKRGEEENKAKVEERVNDEVARKGRGSRKNGNSRRLNKEKDGKQNGKIEKEEAQQGQEENEAKVEEPVNDEVARRGSRKNGNFFGRNRNNGMRFVEKKPKEEKIEISESEGVEKENKSKELKAEKKKKKKKNREKRENQKQEEKARANNEGEVVDELALNAPMPATASVVKEVIGDESHAVKQASVEAERVLKPRIIPRTDDPTVGIGRKFGGISLKAETRTGEHYKYGRGYGNFNHFGRNRERNMNYGRFDRRRELNQRNEGMVWVKKGDVSGGNVSGIQSSNGSSKELY